MIHALKVGSPKNYINNSDGFRVKNFLVPHKDAEYVQKSPGSQPGLSCGRITAEHIHFL
jgi:hypothetical protein